MKPTVKVLIGALIFTLLFILWAGVRISKSVSFSNNCKGYIERAANASTVGLAKEELENAIKYAKSNDLTSGVVSVFFKQPKNDIGYWYNNMTEAYNELSKLPEDQVLENNVFLLKFHQSLMRQGESLDYARHPDGISIYPNNVFFFWWGILSFFGMIVLWIVLLTANVENWDYYYEKEQKEKMDKIMSGT